MVFAVGPLTSPDGGGEGEAAMSAVLAGETPPAVPVYFFEPGGSASLGAKLEEHACEPMTNVFLISISRFSSRSLMCLFLGPFVWFFWGVPLCEQSRCGRGKRFDEDWNTVRVVRGGAVGRDYVLHQRQEGYHVANNLACAPDLSPWCQQLVVQVGNVLFRRSGHMERHARTVPLVVRANGYLGLDARVCRMERIYSSLSSLALRTSE